MNVPKIEMEKTVISSILFYAWGIEQNDSIKKTVKELNSKIFTKPNNIIIRAIQAFLSKYDRLPSKTEIISYMRINVEKNDIFNTLSANIEEIYSYSPVDTTFFNEIIEKINCRFLQTVMKGENNGHKIC